MSTVKFSCAVAPSDPAVPLGCEIWIDDHCVTDIEHVDRTFTIDHDFSDADSNHQLRIVLKNKLPEYTALDSQGNIVSDAVITVSHISFDEIDCTQIVQTHAVYQHNFNGTGPETKDKFFDTLGCNGIVELNFSTPLYLWLLENM